MRDEDRTASEAIEKPDGLSVDQAHAGDDALPAELGATVRDLASYLGDDVRESALCVGDLEGFLGRAKKALERNDLTAQELRSLVTDDEMRARLELLADSLTRLRDSLSRVHGRLHP